MEELESQVAKIQIGNFKKTNSYVHVVTEKAGGSNAELFIVIELPLFNPAAESSCQQISLAIASSLRRSYKHQAGTTTFENAIAQLNDELGKLASSGQTNWVDKLNCVIAVKEDDNFSIATCGKTAAYLYRMKEFTDISTAAGQSHPVKTFENIAFGKLRLGDIVILSTTQLFNYISVDRLKNLLDGYNFLHAAQTIIEILKENAGPEVAFGTILNMQVPLGQTNEEAVDLEEYSAQPRNKVNLWQRAVDYTKSTFALEKPARKPQTELPRVSPPPSTVGAREKMGSIATSLWNSSKSVLSSAKPLASNALNYRKKLNVETFSGFSKQKKLFFISIIVLLIAVITNLVVTDHYKQTKKTQAVASTTIKDIGDLLTKADGLLLYKDETGARAILAQAIAKMPKAETVAADQKESFNAVSNKIDELKAKLEHVVMVQASPIAALSASENIISLPEYFATQFGGSLVSFNKKTGKIEDGVLKSDQTLTATAYISGTVAAAYSDKTLFLWNYQTGTISANFTTNVPAKTDIAGFAFYPTNNRVYLIDKKVGQIVSFQIDKDKISKPIATVKYDFSNAQDLAVDGSIYVLTTKGLEKFQSGKKVDFAAASLLTPFSGIGKIITQKDFKYIYVLDKGNNRIIVYDKKGALVEILQNNQFTKVKDFSIDEKNKTLFVLNDNELFKAQLP